jgi:hypothetical protein
MPLAFSAFAAAATIADAHSSPEDCLPPELALPFLGRMPALARCAFRRISNCFVTTQET